MAPRYRSPAEHGRPQFVRAMALLARAGWAWPRRHRRLGDAWSAHERKTGPHSVVLLAFLIALPTAAQEASRDPVSFGPAVRERIFQEEAPNRNGSVRMECRIDELDSSGQIKKTLLLQHRRTYQNGTMQEELISAAEDGKDVTERQRREEAGLKHRGSHERWTIEDALAPSIPLLGAGRVSYRLVMEKESSEGRWRIIYSPRELKPASRAARGYVVLDDKDGLPVRHHFEPIPMPDWIDRLGTDVRYTRVAGLVVPDSTDTRAEGGFLFVRKRYRIRMRYHDWSLEPAQGQGVSP